MTEDYILITGGARRLAKLIAQFLAENKYNIIIHYNRSQNEAKLLVEDLINTYGVKSLALQANFNNDQEVRSIFTHLLSQNIRVHTLINSASSFNFDDFWNYDDSKWQENFNTNLKAPYLLSLEFSKYLEKLHNIELTNPDKTLKKRVFQQLQGGLGNIVNIVDSWSCQVDTRFLSYNLAKVSLWHLTKVMAFELAPLIRVNGVAPGLTFKPDPMTEERFSEMYTKTPLPQAAAPLDIAKTILFILRNKSLCGEIIKVDCGKSIPVNYTNLP